jgi:hypothetical protein
MEEEEKDGGCFFLVFYPIPQCGPLCCSWQYGNIGRFSNLSSRLAFGGLY